MKKSDYAAYQNRIAANMPSQAETMQRASNLQNTITQAELRARLCKVPCDWQTEIEIESLNAKPSYSPNPALIVAIVDAIIVVGGLYIAPDFRLIVGAIMTCSALSCMVYVGVGMVRRAGR